jgi:hypothetical protein
MTTEFRLLKLERRLPRRPPPSPALAGFDSSRLTPREQFELYRLLCCLAPVRGETCDYRPFGPAQEERLRYLSEIAYGGDR